MRFKHRVKYKSSDKQVRKLLKRRQAIEPIIDNLKSDNGTNKSRLTDTE
jgi:IS5 family transposase